MNQTCPKRKECPVSGFWFVDTPSVYTAFLQHWCALDKGGRSQAQGRCSRCRVYSKFLFSAVSILHKIPRGGFYLGVLIGTTDPAQLGLSHVTCHVSCQPPLSPSRCCCLKVSWKWQILGGSLPKVYMCYPIGQGEPWDPPPQNANFFLSWIFGTLTFLANLLENFRWKTFSPRASGYAENQANIPKKCPLTGGGGEGVGH